MGLSAPLAKLRGAADFPEGKDIIHKDCAGLGERAHLNSVKFKNVKNKVCCNWIRAIPCISEDCGTESSPEEKEDLRTRLDEKFSMNLGS